MDGSAVLTGLLLAFTLPPTVSLWIPIAGAIFGVVVAKHLFGGLGYNIFNPALAARAFLLAAWPGSMTTWQNPAGAASVVDAVSSATPLGALALGDQATPLLQLLLGATGGSLGETSALALLLGAAYLLYKRTVTWHAPAGYLGTMVVVCLALGQVEGVVEGGVFVVLQVGVDRLREDHPVHVHGDHSCPFFVGDVDANVAQAGNELSWR